jgi:hypothetical protein
MSLLDAPAYDPTSDNRKRNILIAAAATIFLLTVLTFAGYISGHGWLFTNLGAEHKVNNFFNALETRDYAKAYGIYYNDPNWQQHPQKYSGYPLARFTEDWTTHSPINVPITSHHIDVSKTDGSGAFGTGYIVAVDANHGHEIFMYLNRDDGTMTWPAPHELTRY